jgi:hypothetical protein
MTKNLFIYLTTVSIFFTSCQSNIDYAKAKINSGNYEDAIVDLKNISVDDKDYNEAQQLLNQVYKKVQDIDSTSEFDTRKVLEDKLVKELYDIDGFDGSDFNTIEKLKVELALFQSWSNLIKEGVNSDDRKLMKLSNDLKFKVERLQVNEFPKMRLRFATVLKKELWTDNIEVAIGGNANSTLTFTGGVFANNANKQEYQSSLSEIFNLLRFKKINYKWYKYDDEYTYYTLSNNPDSSLMGL